MPRQTRFGSSDLAALDRARMLGVRSGRDHRYTGVWVVVVEGRVFVRSWNDAPTGWYRAFRAEPLGSIQVGPKEIAIRAVATRSHELREAVSRAYAAKYATKASAQWASGLSEPDRARHTLELVPA